MINTMTAHNTFASVLNRAPGRHNSVCGGRLANSAFLRGLDTPILSHRPQGSAPTRICWGHSLCTPIAIKLRENTYLRSMCLFEFCTNSQFAVTGVQSLSGKASCGLPVPHGLFVPVARPGPQRFLLDSAAGGLF